MTIVASSSVAPPEAADRRRAALIHYAIEGDARFLSHHEQIRMLTRALLRAGWPLAYSRGFNPQPRLSLPLPRRVGTASDVEYAVVEISEPADPRRLYDALADALPAACRLRRVSCLPKRTAPHPLRASYQAAIEPEHARRLTPAIEALLAAPTAFVERDSAPGQPARRIDVRPYIETITLAGNVLTMCLIFENQRTARPGEILTILQLPAAEYEHRVRQSAVEWDMPSDGLESWPPGNERNSVGQEEDHRCKEESDA